MLTSGWHVSFTVGDIERSVSFYRDILGMELEMAPRELEGPLLAEVTGNPGAHLKVAFVRLGEYRIELIQYLHPLGKQVRLGLNDVGSAHIAFGVDNVQEAYEILSRKGVNFKSKPGRSREDGKPLVFLFDPDGNHLELNERPLGAGAWVTTNPREGGGSQ
jgi:catechol 2,3-dioxygenase-like lactoylglutathione lyase family enzyme